MAGKCHWLDSVTEQGYSWVGSQVVLPDQIILLAGLCWGRPQAGFAVGLDIKLCSVSMQGYRLCPAFDEAIIWASPSSRPLAVFPCWARFLARLSGQEGPLAVVGGARDCASWSSWVTVQAFLSGGTVGYAR